MSEIKFEEARQLMVDQQLIRRKIKSPTVLAAMRTIPREEFLLPSFRKMAYKDGALPIASGQTISQPYIVALMAEAAELRKRDVVLEIGTGSGYSAAVLAELAKFVFTIERIPELADEARATLKKLHIHNVEVHTGDGTLGYPEQAPYDAIVVTAGGPEIPESLKQQLKPGGRLVIPVGETRDSQTLVRVIRVEENNFQLEELTQVRFVRLIGDQGWSE